MKTARELRGDSGLQTAQRAAREFRSSNGLAKMAEIKEGARKRLCISFPTKRRTRLSRMGLMTVLKNDGVTDAGN
ncbi:hypothetical protein [Paenibacillus sp. 32O-W]|uniref:hypothetical protein n=1 Tax=Paenibacillus sp. 32O-W TaxID=1695218 RepID=UPI0011AE8174|nr:hypothetical protein [Paenibacillus sp. 32O-W]